MSQRQHQKQLQQARAKREQSRARRRDARNRLVVLGLVALLVLSLVAGALTGLLGNRGQEPAAPPDEDVPDPGDDPFANLPEPVCPPVPDDAPVPAAEDYDEPPRFEVAPDATYVVTLVTSCGDIVIELDTQGSPRTAENFLALAQDGFYDGTPFHRVIAGFVIQGGDPTGTGRGGPGYDLEDELATAQALEPTSHPAAPEGYVDYPRGTVAMANAGPDTQGSQFFVVLPETGQPFEPAYTVIGTVLEGMDVADDIAAGHVQGDLAIDPVVVLETVIEERPASDQPAE